MAIISFDEFKSGGSKTPAQAGQKSVAENKKKNGVISFDEFSGKQPAPAQPVQSTQSLTERILSPFEEAAAQIPGQTFAERFPKATAYVAKKVGGLALDAAKALVEPAVDFFGKDIPFTMMSPLFKDRVDSIIEYNMRRADNLNQVTDLYTSLKDGDLHKKNIETLLKDRLEEKPIESINPEVIRSARQVFGDALGTELLLAPVPKLLEVTQGMKVLPRALRFGALGAAFGGAEAVSKNEENLPEAANFIKKTVQGAVYGSLTGVILPPLLEKLGQPLSRLFRTGETKLAETVAPKFAGELEGKLTSDIIEEVKPQLKTKLVESYEKGNVALEVLSRDEASTLTKLKDIDKLQKEIAGLEKQALQARLGQQEQKGVEEALIQKTEQVSKLIQETAAVKSKLEQFERLNFLTSEKPITQDEIKTFLGGISDKAIALRNAKIPESEISLFINKEFRDFGEAMSSRQGNVLDEATHASLKEVRDGFVDDSEVKKAVTTLIKTAQDTAKEKTKELKVIKRDVTKTEGRLEAAKIAQEEEAIRVLQEKTSTTKDPKELIQIRKKIEARQQKIEELKAMVTPSIQKVLDDGSHVLKSGAVIRKEFSESLPKLKDLGPGARTQFGSVLDPKRAAQLVDGEPNGIVRRTLYDPVVKALDDMKGEQTRLLNEMARVTGGAKEQSKLKLRFGIKQKSYLIQALAEKEVYPEKFTPDVAKKITPEIEEAAKWFRAQYDDFLERLNAQRLKQGKDPIPKRQDYFTHGGELQLLSSIFGDLKAVPIEVLRSSLYARPNTPFFRFSLPRLMSEFSPDAVRNFKRYLFAATKTLHMSDPIVNIRGHAQAMGETLPNASIFFERWANTLSSKKTGTDRDIPNWFLDVMQAIKARTSKGSVLGNLSTAILQFSQSASTFARTRSAAFRAIPWMFTNEGALFAETNSNVLKSRIFDPDINPNTFGTVEKTLGYLLETMDRMAVRHSFLSGYVRAVDLGMEHQAATKFADDIAGSTQALVDKELQPLIVQGKVGGIIGQLQTFTINLYNQIRRDPQIIAKSEGTREAIKTLAYLFGGEVLMNQIYKGAGLPAPFGDDAGDFILSHIPFVGSVRFSGVPFGTPATQALLAPIKFLAAGDSRKRQEALKDLESVGFATIGPGGRQFYKTFGGFAREGGLPAALEGGVYDKNGNLLFPISGPLEQLRSVLFGPFQTKEGQRYLQTRTN